MMPDQVTPSTEYMNDWLTSRTTPHAGISSKKDSFTEWPSKSLR